MARTTARKAVRTPDVHAYSVVRVMDCDTSSDEVTLELREDSKGKLELTVDAWRDGRLCCKGHGGAGMTDVTYFDINHVSILRALARALVALADNADEDGLGQPKEKASKPKRAVA